MAQEQQLRDMFSRLAPRYNLLNRLMTGGRDRHWRQFAIQKADVPEGGHLLDLGTGTGDLARETLRQHPHARPVAVDFSLEMMRVGRHKYKKPDGTWTVAHALHIPFPADTFDAVVSGFLLRNLNDIMASLREQHRVLKPGGTFVALETTQRPRTFLSPLIDLYLYKVIPTLGKWIAGKKIAYTYLPTSMDHFLRAEKLLAYLAAVGFKKLEFQRFMFGTVAVHWGEK